MSYAITATHVRARYKSAHGSSRSRADRRESASNVRALGTRGSIETRKDRLPWIGLKEKLRLSLLVEGALERYRSACCASCYRPECYRISWLVRRLARSMPAILRAPRTRLASWHWSGFGRVYGALTFSRSRWRAPLALSDIGEMLLIRAGCA